MMGDYDKYELVALPIRPARVRRRMKQCRFVAMKRPTLRKRRLCARTGHPPSRIEDVGETWIHTDDGLIGHTDYQCQRCGAYVASVASLPPE